MTTPTASPDPRPARPLGAFLAIGTLVLAPLTVAMLAGESRLDAAPAPQARAVAAAPATAVPPANASVDVAAAPEDDCGSAEPCLVMSPAKPATARKPDRR